MRLVNGGIPNAGRVEICFNNIWGTICDDSWGMEEARVTCRQLGYANLSDSVPFSRAFFGSGASAIHLDDMACVGSEETLAQCNHSGIGRHNCNNFEDAGVLCIGECSFKTSCLN